MTGPAGWRARVAGWPWRLIAIVAALGLPLATALGLGPPLDVLARVYLLAVLAVGLNIVVGYAGILHLGYAAFFALGAYTAGILTTPKFPFQWSLWFALPVAGLAGAVFGMVLGAPLLRLRGDYLAIVTLGFGEIIQVVLINVTEVTSGNRGISRVGAATPIDWPLGATRHFWYYFALALLAGAILVSRRLECSRWGRALIAIREDELAADCMGVNPVRAKLLAFVASAVVAGVGGAAYGSLASAVFPLDFHFNVSAMLLCMVILGGIGNPYGVVLGAVILTGFDNVVAPWITRTLHRATGDASDAWWGMFVDFKNYRFLLYGVALVLLMRLRPEGLLPSAELRAELHGGGPPEDAPAGAAT